MVGICEKCRRPYDRRQYEPLFTCSNSGVLLAVGRVQTPTLGLVVKRDMQIEGHIKTVYYDIFADVNVETADGNKTVTAKYTKKRNKRVLKISK